MGQGGKHGRSLGVGYGGGGRVAGGSHTAGQGGGRSAIRLDATDKNSDGGTELATAGGAGGGGEGSSDGYGGGGGGLTGGTSQDPERDHGGRGGTQTGKGACGNDSGGNRHTGKDNGNPLNGGGGGGWRVVNTMIVLFHVFISFSHARALPLSLSLFLTRARVLRHNPESRQ